MTVSFHTPKEMILAGHKLFEDFGKTTKIRPGEMHANITGIFLVATAYGLEFVEKASFRGRFEAFKSDFTRFFGIAGSSLDFTKNIQKAEELFKQVSGADEKFFRQAARELQMKPEELRRELATLASYLRKIQWHVELSKGLPHTISPLQQAQISLLNLPAIKRAADLPFEKQKQFQARLKEHLSARFQGVFTEAELETISYQIFLSPSRDECMQNFASLQVQLLKCLAVAKDRDVAPLAKAVQHLAGPVAPQEFSIDKLREFALVFGDSFILGDKKLEGDVGTIIYANIIQDFFKQPHIAKQPKIISVLDNAINLRGRVAQREDYVAMGRDISQKLSQNGRVLFYGGWKGHAITYEVEKQPNGKLSFSIYNEGAGRDIYTAQEARKVKISGYIEVQEIPEEYFLRPAFLASLTALNSHGEGNPADMLINKILPLLDGKIAPPDLRMDRLLSPQRSGTCTYRSLLAYLAHSMPEQEYKLFKCDFKLFMLQRFKPQLDAFQKIENQKQLEEATHFHNIVSRSLEKMASSIDKLQLILPTSKMQELERVILDYQAKLKAVSLACTSYELGVHRAAWSSIDKAPPRTAEFRKEAILPVVQEERALPPNHFSEKAFAIMAAIEAIPPSNDPRFTEQVLQAVTKINRDFVDQDYIVETLFRKIGGLEGVSKLNFANAANEGVQELTTLNSRLASGIVRNSARSYTQRYLCFFLAIKAYEMAYRALPQEVAVLSPGFASILGHINREFDLLSLTTTDPFWADQIRLLGALKEPAPFSPKSIFNYEEPFQAPDSFSQDVWKWFCQKGSPEKLDVEIKKEVNKDLVESDKLAIEKEIEETTKALSENIAQKEAEFAAIVDPEVRSKALRELEKMRLCLTNVPGIVMSERPPQPEPFDIEKCSIASKVAFLLAKGQVPEPLKTFVKLSSLCQSIFYKVKDDFDLAKCTPSLAINRKKSEIGMQMECPGFIPPPNSTDNPAVLAMKILSSRVRIYNPMDHDLFSRAIKDWKIQKVYTACIYGATQEGEIPASVTRQQEYFSKLDHDKIRELFALRSVDEIRIESILDYFDEHEELLADLDHLAIFSSLLFQADILLKELEVPARREIILPKLQQFFRSKIQNCLQVEAYSTAANIAWLASKVQGYIDYESEEAALIPASTVISIIESSAGAKFSKQKPAIYQALIAALATTFPKMPQDAEQKKLFSYFALLEAMREKLDDNIEVASLFRDDHQFALTHLRKLASEATTQNEIVEGLNLYGKQLLSQTFTQLKRVEFRPTETLGCFTTVAFAFDLTRHSFFAKDKALFHLYEKQLTYNVEDRLKYGVQIVPNSSMRCFREQDIYYVQDSERNASFRVDMKEGKVWMKSPQGTQWLPCISVESPQYLQEHVVVQGEKELFVLDPNTLKVVCQGEPDKLRSKARPELLLAWPPFTSADHPLAVTSTTFWTDEREVLQEIHFRRLGVTLKRTEKRDKTVWQFAEQPEWYLAEEQFVTALGKVRGLLRLENDRGEQKVLIPLPFLENRFVECDIVGNALVPKNLEARYALANLYLGRGLLDEAEKLLFDREAECSSRPQTAAEYYQLMQLIPEPRLMESQNSRALKLGLQAAYLFQMNSEQFPREHHFQDTIKKLANEYLSRLGHIKPLEPRCERLILKSLSYTEAQSDLILRRQVEWRLKELAGQEEGLQEVYEELSKDWLSGIVRGAFSHFWEPTINRAYIDCSVSEQDRISYLQHRAKGSFPFNPTNPTEEEMRRFYPLIHKEVGEAKEKGMQSGIIAFLTHMSLFGTITDCKNIAARDLKEFSLHAPEKISVIHLKKAKKESIDLAIAEETQSLTLLQTVQATALPLHDMAKATFQAHTKPAPSREEEPFSVLDMTKGDPVLKKEFEAARRDVEAARTLPTGETFSLQPGKTIEELRANLAVHLPQETKKLAVMEHAIVTTTALALTSDPESVIRFQARKRHLPTIEELSIATARADFDAILKNRYPELSQEARATLKRATTQYLEQKKLCQQLQRAFNSIDNYLKTGKELDLVASTLNEKANYAPHDPLAPVLLLAETALNITLRQDQVDKIRTYAGALKAKKPIALQMIMGAGKTSVLQPILALLLAESDSLSTVMIPEPLFEAVRQSLSKTLGKAYEQFVFWMPYERQLAKKLDYVKTFRARLEAAKEQGTCVLLTPRQKHSIITSLYEAYHDYHKTKDSAILARLETISEIVSLMQLHEVSQVDEIDTVMNSQITFKYPLGEMSHIDAKRGRYVSQLLLELASDKELAKRVRLDFVERFQQRQVERPERGADLTQALFDSIVKPAAVRHAKQLLQKELGPVFERDSNRYIEHFLGQTTPHDEQVSMLCLETEEAKIAHTLPADIEGLSRRVEELKRTGEKKELAVAEKLLFQRRAILWIANNIPDNKLRQLLGALSHAIADVMKKSLFKECNSHYGVDPKTGVYIARPYDAPDSPKPTVYSDAYEQLIHALQLVLYQGVPSDAAKIILTKFQTQAKKEMKSFKCPLQETDAFKAYASIMQEEVNRFSFFEEPPTSAFLEAFQRQMNKNDGAILHFVENYLFEQITVFEKSLSSTPQTVVGTSKVSGGYTGTLESALLAKGCAALPELGTDSRTILAVHEKIRTGDSAIAFLSPTQVIDTLSKDNKLQVFIDSGGWLKDLSLDDFTKELFAKCEKERPDVKAIAYIDREGKKMSLERKHGGELVRVPLDQSQYITEEGHHITIIPQKYETGTNILQKPDAKALVSIRKNMTKRDAVQSIFRMRQILAGQNVILALSDEVQNHVKSTIIDALLEQGPFRALLSPDTKLEMANVRSTLEAMRLPQGMQEAIFKAFETLIGKNLGRMNQKEYFVEFLKCFFTSYIVTQNDLWSYFVVNQAESSKEKSWLAAQQRMRECLEKPVRLILQNPKIPLNTRLSLFEASQQLFMQELVDDTFAMMTQGQQMLEAKVAVERQIEHSMNLYHKIKQTIGELYPSSDAMREELQACAKLDELPQVIFSPDKGVGNQLEFEAQAQKEEQKEKELEQEVEVEQLQGEATRVPYMPLFTTVADLFRLDVQRKEKPDSHHPVANVSAILPKETILPDAGRIGVSYNLFINGLELGTMDQALYFQPGRFLLAIGHEPNERRYLIVSHEDASRLKQGLLQATLPPSEHLVLYSLNGRAEISSTKAAHTFFENEIGRIRLQAKLCCAKVKYTKEEIAAFRSLIDSHPNPSTYAKQLKKLFENQLKYLPEARLRYKTSALQKLFLSYTV